MLPKPLLSCPILTYHSQNICGDDYAHNDHVALRDDLRVLLQAGRQVVPLDWLLDVFDGSRTAADLAQAVVLTFDDGCDFDVRDLDYPGHGPQRSFAGIFADHIKASGNPPLRLHATAFVIANREARRVIDAGSLFGKGWISDDWWRDTDRHGLIAIENHGWDHNHPDLAHPDLAGKQRGRFHTVDTEAQCLQQVVAAAGAIEAVTGRWPRYFAYPFGESSAWIRSEFFPHYTEAHGCRAALGTEPRPVTPASDRWNLPRYVCGRDWKSAQELLALITA
jgi:peptidoglycan/xylan/chitin deacetylase (PgdA/CDA1 family)